MSPRQVVLHTATLVASGTFLLCVAVAGILLTGPWRRLGPPLQLAMLIGSLFVLAVFRRKAPGGGSTA